MLCAVYKNGTLVEWRVSEWTVMKKIVKPEMSFGACAYNHSEKSTLVYSTNNTSKANMIEEYGENNQYKSIEIDLKVTKMMEI